MEKEQPTENVRPLSHSSDKDGERQEVENDPKWQPGFAARFPWFAFAALVTILVCCASSITILEVSDGRSQSSWPDDVAPNVLLSVMTGIANICFAVVLTNGIAIAWWRKTLKGATITDLYRSWASTNDIQQLLLGMRYLDIIALAALAAKLTVIDGILMQRATDTYLAYNNAVNVSTISGFSNQTFPITGTVIPETQQPGLMMHWMGDNLKLWSQKGGIYPNQWTGCEGLCYLKVPGVGFAFDCDSPVQTSIDYGQQLTDALKAGENGAEVNLFNISFSAVYSDGAPTGFGRNSSYLTMKVSYTQADDTDQKSRTCPGKKHQQTCRLWPAIINYPVQILNSSDRSSVSVGPMLLKFPNGTVDEQALEDLGGYDYSLQQQAGFEVLDYISILESHTSPAAADLNSTLSGIQIGLDMYIQSQSILSWNTQGNGQFIIDQMGHSANFMTDPPSDPQSCSFTYQNPLETYSAPNGLFKTPSIIGEINQIMFGLTTDISQDNPSNGNIDGGDRGLKTYTATVYKQSIHYKSHFAYMWGAVAATLVCILLILPVFWGFWELGRPVTMNPFEIAQAFRSPVTAQASTAETNDLLKELGNQQIKYGPILSGDDSGRYGVAEPQNVAFSPRISWRASRLPG